MSIIEELVYSAYEHGKRTQLLENVTNIKQQHPNMKLEEIYELAYKEVMNT